MSCCLGQSQQYFPGLARNAMKELATFLIFPSTPPSQAATSNELYKLFLKNNVWAKMLFQDKILLF